MADKTWRECLKIIKKYVFKIYTPNCSGTGFQLSYGRNHQLIGIATALHVIDHANEWEGPIKLVHLETGKTTVIHPDERVVYAYSDKDLAFIIFKVGELKAEKQDLQIIDPTKYASQGVEMGWCGFPAVAPKQLCFFTGHISCWLNDEESYLVDGVAINGVSGGPAFTKTKDGPRICGVVSAYMPNRATGESLPGVCVIRDVGPYQDVLKKLTSLEEAAEKAKEEKEKEKEQATEAATKKKSTKRAGKKKVATKKKSTKRAGKKKVATKKKSKKRAGKKKVAKKRRVAKRKK